MSGDYRDFEIRKSVHVNLTRDTHAAFRGTLFKKQLSMQEVFEECAIRIVENESYFLNLLNDIKDRKRQKLVRKFTKTDAESIFKIIEEQDPFIGGVADEAEKP
tara:strand:+ start:6913 stop:7224 length:312 start_codon:yes stop_codon:yes gene_type:complete